MGVEALMHACWSER